MGPSQQVWGFTEKGDKETFWSNGQFSILLRMWVTHVYALPKLREWFAKDQDNLLLKTLPKIEKS